MGPKNWGRQAAGDLHPEACRKPAEISPAQELGTASGRGLTPRNLQKTCRNQPRPTTGDGKLQGTGQSTGPGPGPSPTSRVVLCASRFVGFTYRFVRFTSRFVRFTSRFASFTSRFGRCTSRVVLFTSRFGRFTSRFVCFTSRFVPPGLQV